MRGRIRHADYTDQPGNRHPGEAEETLQTVTDFLKGLNLEKLITLLLLLAGCLVVMKLVLRLTDRAFLRLELERSLHTFIHAALRVILWMITLCIVLDYVGVPMTSLVAVLSVIGLAVSLAIQGTLSNLAGGIQVLLPMALAEPEPFVRVNAYRDSSIEYVVRVWCATGDYWTLYYDLLEQVKEAFDQNGIEMTYNHLNVHLVERKEEEQ